MKRIAIGLTGLVALALGLFQLEAARSGIDRMDTHVGTTPVTVLSTAPGPVVVIAHGFAGSRQLMDAYALSLARAGYVTVAFDFEGHGANPTPMSGDVTRIDGTTKLLMDETRRVIAFARDLPQSNGQLALLGHSMATDVIARVAIEGGIETVIGISMFSQAVTAEAPARLLTISGQFEGMLREAGVDMLNLVAPGGEGDTVAAGDTLRRAVVAPGVEHVGVLYSRTGITEARDWLDAAFDRASSTPVAAIGGWIVLALAGVVAIAWPLGRLLPFGLSPRPVPNRVFWIAALGPAILTPLILAPLDVRFLPVLVADYLAVHAAVYGLLALIILRAGGVRIGGLAPWAAVALTVWGIVLFGGILHRYAASFAPIPARWPIVAAIVLGMIPAFITEAALTQAGRSSLLRKTVTRLGFLGSLGIAVALDFERLFFLILIIPLIALFYGSFGVVGGWVGRRTGAVLSTGIGLGICLGWALGVSFPMFDG